MLIESDQVCCRVRAAVGHVLVLPTGSQGVHP